MTTTAKSRYMALVPRREPFLRRARQCAEVTIPALMPPEGNTDHSVLPEPYSSLGARGVTHLANRLMMAMYPAGRRSFLLQVPPAVLQEAGVESVEPDTELALSKIEERIQTEVENRQWRQPTNVSLQYLIVTGNALEWMLPNNTIKVYRLDQYVVVRDPAGEPVEIVLQEWLYPAGMDETLKAMLSDSDVKAEKVALYTWGKRQSNGQWKIHQELSDNIVPDSEGYFDVSPLQPLVWDYVIGEDYGRSKVEIHLADLRAVNGLRKAGLDGAALASRNITMIRPNAAGGLNLKRRIDRAENGASIVGNPEDVSMLQFQNQAGMQVVDVQLDKVIKDVGSAFLLYSAVRRDAERVTAVELRQDAEELEGTLGGIYSRLAATMQAFRLKRLIHQMQGARSLPEWPEGAVEPVILTGLESLGREQDVQRAQIALQSSQALPEIAQDYVKWEVLLKKIYNGLELPDAVRTEDQANQVRQQRMMTEAAQQMAVGGATEMMKQQGGGE